MIIQQKRVRTLKGKLPGVKRGATLVLGAKLVPSIMPKLYRVGFPQNAGVGDAVLPTAIGPTTNYNANGTIIVHRDRPMETAYREMEWHWTEFRGRYDSEEMSKIVDVPYKRYSRTDVPPPSLELKIAVTADGQRVLVAPPVTYKSDDDAILVHTVNLMLEVVGFCQAFTTNLGDIISAPLRRLNWKILPSGKRTWKQLRGDVSEIIKMAKAGNQPVIEHRLEAINQHGPDFVAVGLAGFAGYVVFGFSTKQLFVFESIYSGNATYVFGSDWEALSQMTKMQILDHRLQKHRIIHRAGWDAQIYSLLARRVVRQP